MLLDNVCLSQADINLRDGVVAIKQIKSQETRSLETENAIDKTCKILAIKKGHLQV